jgi:hypothetical protein
MRFSTHTFLGTGLAVSVFLGGLWTETHKPVRITGSAVQVVDQNAAQGEDPGSTSNDSNDAAEIKDNLTEDDVKAATACVGHRPSKFDSYGTALGGTLIKPIVPGEDNLRCWTMTMTQTALGDLNGDGKGDAVAQVNVGSPYSQEIHIVPFINEHGKAVQVDDVKVTSVYCTDDFKIDSGKLLIDFASEEKPYRLHCQFKLSNDKLVQIAPLPRLQNDQSISAVPLTKNPHDVLLVNEPQRYADMLTRGETIKTKVRANQLTRAAIQEAIFSERKRLMIDDPWCGCGTIQQIAYGDFTGDNRRDAVVIVSTGRADHDQLDMIPVVIEDGHVTLYGAVPLGAGGYDTWEEKLRIDSGKIKVRIKVGMKFQPPQTQTWISWNFEVRNGKLLKML